MVPALALLVGLVAAGHLQLPLRRVRLGAAARRRLFGGPRRLQTGVMPIVGHRIKSQRTGTDYYAATIAIGTPGSNFDVIIDTGSTLAYIPCTHTCKKCGHHDHRPFNTAASSTFRVLQCGEPMCNPSPNLSNVRCDGGQCRYSKSYLEGSSNAGVIVQDVVQLRMVGNISASTAVPFAFGCTRRETGLIYGQDADGVMGVALADISLPSQLSAHGFSKVFSMCMAPDGAGNMVFGDTHAELYQQKQPLMWTPMIRATSGHARSWYIVGVKEFKVGGTSIGITQAEYQTFGGYGGAMIDTGTTDLMVPQRMYDLLNSAVTARLEKNLRRYTGGDGNMCYQGNSNTNWNLFPDILADFGTARIVMKPMQYVLDVSATTRCLSIFTHSGMIIGSNQLLDILTIFDRQNKRIGFMPTQCSVRLGQPAPTNQGKTNQALTPRRLLRKGLHGGVVVVVAVICIITLCVVYCCYRKTQQAREVSYAIVIHELGDIDSPSSGRRSVESEQRLSEYDV